MGEDEEEEGNNVIFNVFIEDIRKWKEYQHGQMLLTGEQSKMNKQF